MRQLIPTLWVAFCVTLPRLAWACPQCAGRNEGGVVRGILIASMMVLPFVITGVVYKVIREGEYGDSANALPAHDGHDTSTDKEAK